MSIIAPAVGESYRVRVQSYHSLNPSQKWSNNYILRCVNPTDIARLRGAAQMLLEFHANATYMPIVTERAVVSTYIADTNPYDGNEFTAVEYGSSGIRALSSDFMLALEVCLYLRKEVPTGRVGKIFLRGALSEDDVEFGQSLFKLSAPLTMQTMINTALTDSGADSLFTTGDNDFVLVIPTGASDPNPSRGVTNLTASGARMVNMNKRYYDRA